MNSSRQFCYFTLVTLTGLIALLASMPSRAAAAQAAASGAPLLSLDDFLAQARKGNTGAQGDRDIAEATELRRNEGDLLTSTTTFFNFQYSHDGKPQAVPLFTYRFQNTESGSFGFSKATEYGLTARLSTNVVAIDYDGAALSPLLSGSLPAGFQLTSFGNVNTTTALELSQSLWSNGFGRALRAHKAELEAATMAQSYGSRYSARVVQTQAESAYWRLALARQAVELTRDNMERASRNYDWNSKRARLQLTDQSDALQSQALYEVRRLDYQRAVDEEGAAARAFNAARGSSSGEVPERLAAVDVDTLLAMQPPKRAQLRDDVKAAQQSQLAAQAGSRASVERDSPTLDLFGTLALNGQDTTFGPAYKQAYSLDHPTAAVGVRFSTPLDIPAAWSARAAYGREERAADLIYQRKVFDQEEQWRDLSERLIESQRKLKLSRSIEKAQEAKLYHERERLRTGRSTSFQVVSFETDYALAELGRLQAQGEILAVLTQMKLFGDEL